MNERIRQFERESHIDVYGLGLDRAKWETSLEKFAELIVRECADVGSKFSQAHPEDICYQIKRHFGVEE